MVSKAPSDWRDLQTQVSRILLECGLHVELEKVIATVRGETEIDVYAEDHLHPPSSVYLCECKHWKRNVPQHVVHSFRTVVTDAGANVGMIVSSSGFQSGAYEAAEVSNIWLLTWNEFQGLFVDRWIESYFAPTLSAEVEPLFEYTERANNRIFRKSRALSDRDRTRFRRLQTKYWPLAYFQILLRPSTREWGADLPPVSTMLSDWADPNSNHSQELRETGLPSDLFEQRTFRDFLETYCGHVHAAIAEFDDLFGGRT